MSPVRSCLICDQGWAEHTWPRGIITVGFVPGYDYSEKNEELVIKYINEAYNFLGVKFKPQHLDWVCEVHLYRLGGLNVRLTSHDVEGRKEVRCEPCIA